jgi:hypothetical protein
MPAIKQYTKTALKTGCFPHLLTYKLPKNAIFHSKVLNKIYVLARCFLRNTLNFTIFIT